jgi:hypothetical protein
VNGVDETDHTQLALYLTFHIFSGASSLPFPLSSETVDPPPVPEAYYIKDPVDPWLHAQPRANAVLVMLARNSDVQGAVDSVRRLEDRFNRRRRYPWVFLNEVEFDDNFKRCVLCPERSY